MPFANPVMAGTQLVRNTMQSANFSEAAQTGWAIMKNGDAYFFNITAAGTVTATTVVAHGATGGVFVYSGVPAHGNLICSMAGVAGTDGFGNAYPEGFGLSAGAIPGGLINPGSIPATAVSFSARSIGGITTTVSATAPASPVNGDLWINTASGNALYQYSSGTWSLYQFGTGSIAAASITAAQIAANTITASQIAAGTITAAQIAAATITASLIAAGAIGTSQLAAGSVTATQLAAGIVYAGIVNGTTINAATFTGSVFQGTDFILNSSGAFWYSGTPATGNLILSIAQTAGTDGFGNAYLAGYTAYHPGVIAAQLLNSVLAFFAQDGHPFSLTPSVSAGGDGVTGASLALTSGASTGTAATADLQLYDSVAGQAFAGGAYAALDVPLYTAAETWHSLGTPSGATVTLARYRMLPVGLVIIELVAVNVTTPAASVTFPNTLPSAYWPANLIRQPLSMQSASGASGHASVNATGTVQLVALGGTLSGQYDATFIYPVI